MRPEHTTKLLAATSWVIPLAFVALDVMLLSLHFWQNSAAVELVLIGLTLCALVLAVVCGAMARSRSGRLHGGKYFWLATLGFYMSLVILTLYVTALAVLVSSLFRQ